MEAKLVQVSLLPQKDKGPAYVSLVTDVIAKADPATFQSDVRQIVEVALQDNVVIGRQVLQELAKGLGQQTIKDAELRKAIVHDALEIAQPRLVSYEEQVGLSALHDIRDLSDYQNLGQRLATHPRRYSRERGGME